MNMGGKVEEVEEQEEEEEEEEEEWEEAEEGTEEEKQTEGLSLVLQRLAEEELGETEEVTIDEDSIHFLNTNLEKNLNT